MGNILLDNMFVKGEISLKKCGGHHAICKVMGRRFYVVVAKGREIMMMVFTMQESGNHKHSMATA